MKYKRNFITSVILKVDFNMIDGFDASKFAELKKEYPIEKVHQRTEFLTQLSKEKQTVDQRTFSEYRYYDENMENYFSVSESSCFFELKNHVGFDVLKKQFEKVFATLKNQFNFEDVNRVGLRYINVIPYNKGTDWRKYIAAELSSIDKFYNNIGKKLFKKLLCLSRVSLKNEDTIINFIAGNPNKNYPAAITKEELLLDYDSFCSNVDVDDVVSKLEILHQNILSLFEKSITEELRILMKVEEK